MQHSFIDDDPKLVDDGGDFLKKKFFDRDDVVGEIEHKIRNAFSTIIKIENFFEIKIYYFNGVLNLWNLWS